MTNVYFIILDTTKPATDTPNREKQKKLHF